MHRIGRTLPERAFGLALWLVASIGCGDAGAPVVPPTAAQPDVLLVTIDTLRADHLGAYGYARSTSAAIDALAAGGILFERATSQAPWTLPSMATLHTSLYPSEHGANNVRFGLHADVTTLAETLQGEGYHTVAVVSHLFVGRDYGFAQGFARFEDSQGLTLASHSAPPDVTSSELTQRALAEVAQAPDRPLFLWVHYFDPHYTYVRHEEYGFAQEYDGAFSSRALDAGFVTAANRSGALASADLAYVKAVYDEEIAFTDAAIGRLLEGVAQHREDRPRVVFLTADHGEFFMEHARFGHDENVYQPLLHVPLIVAGAIDPALVGRRVSQPVETRSTARSIARLVGAAEAPFGGRDLLAVARGESEAALIFAEGSHAWGVGSEPPSAVISGDWKLVFRPATGATELFDLAEDPLEATDLWSRPGRDPAVKPLQRELAEFIYRMREGRRRVPRRQIELPGETEDRLRALGYGS